MVTFGAVQSTVQAPPTGRPCITMLSNRYASIPCQASLRPAIYGPILGRQFMGQSKAGKIMGQFMAGNHWIWPIWVYRFRVITFVFTTEVEPAHVNDGQLLSWAWYSNQSSKPAVIELSQSNQRTTAFLLTYSTKPSTKPAFQVIWSIRANNV